jgi:plastocyanin
MPEGHRFSPSTIEVTVGEQITFENDSSESHTVTAFEESLPDGADYFASGGAATEDEARDNVGDGLIDGGDTFTLTLDEPGTYKYFCIPHESQGMTGTIVVSDE